MPNLRILLKMFRMSKEKSLFICILLIIVLAFNKSNFTNSVANIFPEIKSFIPQQNEINNLNLENSQVAKVVYIADGDTVTIQLQNGEKEIVRLLAVNTLEMDSLDEREKCLAKMAKDFTSNSLLNKEVQIISDPTQPKRDKYGRLLLYLKVIDHEQTFNEELMYSGLAKTYKASPSTQEWQKYENIRILQEKDGKGIWDNKLCTMSTY